EFIEGGEVEPLREDEDVCDDIAATAGNAERRVVTAGARVRLRRRDAVEAARKLERTVLVGQGGSGPFHHRPSATFLDGPHCREQRPTEREQRIDRHRKLLTVGEVRRHGYFPPDWRLRQNIRRERSQKRCEQEPDRSIHRRALLPGAWGR